MSRFFLDHSYYFITVPTINRFPFFNTFKSKKIILDRIKVAQDRFGLEKLDFGIISNHHHCLAYFSNGQIIPRFLQFINGGSAYELNKITNNKKPVWDEYFVYIPRSEITLQKIKGYTVGNPLKHGEVKDFQELKVYPFSSYNLFCEEVGSEQAKAIVQSVIAVDENEFIKTNLTKIGPTKVG